MKAQDNLLPIFFIVGTILNVCLNKYKECFQQLVEIKGPKTAVKGPRLALFSLTGEHLGEPLLYGVKRVLEGG